MAKYAIHTDLHKLFLVLLDTDHAPSEGSEYIFRIVTFAIFSAPPSLWEIFQLRRHLSRKIESKLSAYSPCVSTRVKLATSQNSPQLQSPFRGVNKKRPSWK